MAISPALDVKVSIKHNSEALPEHINREATPDNDETAFKHIIRYIQVPDADDREFSIHVDFDALDPTALLGTALEWHIVVDGRPVDGIVITPSMIESHYSNGRTCLSRGQYASGRVRPFKFANLEVGATEEAEEKLDDTRKSGLGTIRVEVHHVELRGVSHSQSNTQNSGVSNLGRLAEKDLKGRPIAHSVSYVTTALLPQKSITDKLSAQLWRLARRSRLDRGRPGHVCRPHTDSGCCLRVSLSFSR